MIGNKSTAIVVFLCLLLSVGFVGIYFTQNKQLILFWWEDQTREHPHHLFIGSSSIRRLPKNVVQDCKPAVLYGLDHGTVERVFDYLRFADLSKAKTITLYIGENDLARGEQPEQTFDQFARMFDVIREMNSNPIAIMTIKHSPARSSAHHRFASFNTMLRNKFSGINNVTIIEFDRLLDVDSFSADGVHLTDIGYERLGERINKFCISSINDAD